MILQIHGDSSREDPAPWSMTSHRKTWAALARLTRPEFHGESVRGRELRTADEPGHDVQRTSV
jgi:hypothetical protein